jgi:hypothetical protein
LVSFQTAKQLLGLALVVPADLADDEMSQEGSRRGSQNATQPVLAALKQTGSVDKRNLGNDLRQRHPMARQQSLPWN